MKKLMIEERAIRLAEYIIDHNETVRGVAKEFGISKSTVHTDVTYKNGKNMDKLFMKVLRLRIFY